MLASGIILLAVYKIKCYSLRPQSEANQLSPLIPLIADQILINL
jgi:hypothetical protein